MLLLILLIAMLSLVAVNALKASSRLVNYKSLFIYPIILNKVNTAQRLSFKAPLRCSASSFSTDTVVTRCTSKIREALKPVKVQVTASNDDPNGSHVNILCVSEEFEGKNVMQRQRLVYKAIWDELSGPVHAVDSIVAKTPKEAGL